MRLSKISVLFAIVITFVVIAGCSSQQETTAEKGANEPITVVATFYPLHDWATEIGKDKVNVVTLVPAGVAPHEWEPTPRDVEVLHKADLFIYNGADMEPWVDRVIESIERAELVIVNTSKGIELLDDPEGEGTDPHIWLDPVNAMQQTDLIATGLIKADADNKDFYQENLAAYRVELEKLHQEYQAELEDLARREIVTPHYAFGYLAKRYDLKQVAMLGVSTEAEPSIKEIAEIVEFAKEYDVKYIFYETLISPALAETIAQEVGAGTMVLDPIEGLTPDAEAKGENYLSLMRQNLENLRRALQ